MSKANIKLVIKPRPTSQVTSHPILLGESGHEYLVNFKFNLRAPWKACRLCGAVYQSELDRQSYEMALTCGSPEGATFEQVCEIHDEALLKRGEWLRNHNRSKHTQRDIELLNESGLAVTPEAAKALAPYGIIPIGDTVYLDEIDAAFLEAPRAPINDCEG